MDTFWVWLPTLVLVSALVMVCYFIVLVIERLGWLDWADREWSDGYDIGYDTGYAHGANAVSEDDYKAGFIDGAMSAFADERERVQS